MSVQATEQKADPVEVLVQETEHLHEQVERLGDVIGSLSLRPDFQEDLPDLQGVYGGLSSACEVVAKASLRLSKLREEDEQPVTELAVAPSTPSREEQSGKLDAKVTLLQTELTSLIRDSERKQRRDRAAVVLVKMLSILFASMLVIVLAWRGGEALLLRNINLALILGVGILTLSFYEAYFDHRAGWLRRALILSRLKNLRRDLMFAVSSAESFASEDVMIKNIKRRLDAVLHDEMREWSAPEEELKTSSAGER